MGDFPIFESAADDHAESVRVDVILGDGGGFDDAAGDKAGLPPDQFGGSECVGEDIVVQARDTAESIR